MTVWELGGFYRPGGDSHGFDILVGVREIDLAQDLTINFPMFPAVDRGSDGSFTDGFVGVRYANLFYNYWSFFARLDYSAGGTEGTLNAVICIGYELGESGKYALRLGWREMEIEVEDTRDGSRIETEV